MGNFILGVAVTFVLGFWIEVNQLLDCEKKHNVSNCYHVSEFLPVPDLKPNEVGK